MTIQQHQPAPPSVAQTIQRYAPMIAEALPRHLNPDRFTRLALTTLRKNPTLQQCAPESFIGALLTASALGLEPDVNGECYLVPYKRECTLIVGYQGVSKMFWQHQMADRLSSDYVCANDRFEFRKGTDPYILHEPALGDRGPVIAYYAIVGLKNGALWFDVFTPDQIKALRGSVRPSNVRDPEHWMERKTALKQVLKLAPKSTSLAVVSTVDEQPGSMQKALSVATAAKDAQPAPAPEHAAEVVDGELVDPETGEVADWQPAEPTDTTDPWAEQGVRR